MRKNLEYLKLGVDKVANWWYSVYRKLIKILNKNLHDGMIVSSTYIRDTFLLDSIDKCTGIEYYISKDGNYYCNLYKDSINARVEKYK